MDEEDASMAKTPQVGEEAPDFELSGTDGPFRLSDHRGERVVLLFYPGDNTPVCTKADVLVSRSCLMTSLLWTRRWSGYRRRTWPPTRDSSRRTASRCRCWLMSKAGGEGLQRLWSMGTKRAVIVIDEDGIVRHRHDHLLGLDYQSVDDLKAALDTLPAPAAS